MAEGKGKEAAIEGQLLANSDCSDANSGSAIKRKANDLAISSSSAKKRIAKMPMPEAPPAREVNMSMVQFLFEKKLTQSDVSGPNRILIPKASAQKFLPKLDENESTYIFMDDMAGAKVWTFLLRSWQNCGTKMFVLENTAKYVEAHAIKVGDFIIIYKDNKTERYAVGFRRENEIDFSNDYHPEFAPEEETNLIFPPNHKFDSDVDPLVLGMTKEEFLEFNPFDWFPNDK